jgi:hypothetical protein
VGGLSTARCLPSARLCTISRFWPLLLDLHRYKLINSMLNFEFLCKAHRPAETRRGDGCAARLSVRMPSSPLLPCYSSTMTETARSQRARPRRSRAVRRAVASRRRGPGRPAPGQIRRPHTSRPSAASRRGRGRRSRDGRSGVRCRRSWRSHRRNRGTRAGAWQILPLLLPASDRLLQKVWLCLEEALRPDKGIRRQPCIRNEPVEYLPLGNP